MSLRASFIAVLSGLLLAACAPELPLPSGLQLSCSDTRECPSGYTCNPGLHRCLKADELDPTPPALEGPAAPSPAVLGRGARTTLRLTASEALAFAPEVALALSTPRPFTFEADASSANTYVFTYVAAGDEPQDVDVPVSLLLTDSSGNQTRASATLRFDFLAPTLSSVSVAGSPARESGAVRVSFSVSEPLASAPQVQLGSGVALTLEGTEVGGRYVFVHTARGSEASAESLRITATDTAGNTVSHEVPTALAFDFTPPALAQAAEVLTPRVRAGFSALVRLSASEPLGEVPQLELVPESGPGLPLAMSLAEQAGDTSTFVYRVTAADTAGTYVVRAQALTDVAGNASGPLVLGSLAIDTQAPQLVGGVRPSRSPAMYKAGDVLEVALTADEPLQAPPVVRLATANPLPLACTPTEENSWRCSLTLSGRESPEGPTAVAVELLDEAGNAAFASTTVVLDFTPPQVVPGSEQVWLLPAEGNPLARVTRVTAGTTVQLSFVLSESFQGTPAVTSTAPETLAFTRLTGEGLAYAHTLSSEAHAQGAYTLQVEAVDLAGNVGTSTLTLPAPGFVVDTEAPAPPAVDVAGRLLYRRMPWGTASTGGARRFTVEGGAGAVEGEATVTVHDGTALATAAELGRGRAAADGTFAPVVLNTADRPVVAVRAVDAAGNGSPLVEVRDVEWTASLGFKQPGESFDNPTRLVLTPRLTPFPEAPVPGALEPTAQQLAAMLLPDGQGVTLEGQPGWESGVRPDAPTYLFGSLVTDVLRGQAVLVAQDSGSSQLHTWELDLLSRRWSQRLPVSAPPTRSGSALAYDPVRGKAVLFGGSRSGSGPAADLWEWDAGAGTWVQRVSTGPWPQARIDAHLAYDASRRTLVLFGGRSSTTTLFNDVWEWDTTAGGWTHRTPATLPASWPAARGGGAFVYDEARRKVLLVGGVTVPDFSGSVYYDDVWEWDGATGTWANRTPGTRPPADDARAAAYDVRRRKVVLFGGRKERQNEVTPASLWEWDGAAGTFTRRTPADATAPWPTTRYGGALTYDPLREALVLHGGYLAGFPTPTDRTWLWSGASGTWVEWGPSEDVRDLGRVAGVHVPESGRTWLFAESQDDTTQLARWDMPGARWLSTLRFSEGAPGLNVGPWDGTMGRLSAAMASAPGTGGTTAGLLLFGGRRAILSSGTGLLSDLWRFDLSTNQWQLLANNPGSTTWPAARWKHAMVREGSLGSVLLFGGLTTTSLGSAQRDVWRNAGGAWTNLTPNPLPASWPPALSETSMTSDPDGHVFLFGGRTSVGVPSAELWEWNAAAQTWTNRTPAALPTSWPEARHAASLTWSTARRKLLLFGGVCSACAQDGSSAMWEYDPASSRWRKAATTSLPPSSRDTPSLTYSPTLQRALLAGGTPWGNGSAWEWDDGATSRAAALWTVPFSLAGAEGATVQQVALTAHAGGRGSTLTASTAVNGARLLAWSGEDGTWQQVGSAHTAAPGASQAASRLQYVTTDATTLRRLLATPQQSLVLAVTPTADNGSAPDLGQLWVDALEAAVRYRR